MLVVCRVLQGCGGAMMVPVARLTLVRTFGKSELIRAMSFVAAIGLKVVVPRILNRLGYRRTLLANPVALGAFIGLFATIGWGTPIWLIVLQALCFGFCSSLQYTSMNTLAYAEVRVGETSMASTIVSTMQQMSMSFGVAAASLATTLFIPDRFHSDATQMIHGVHQAFLVLGGLTVLSALVFRELKKEDGDSISLHHVEANAG